MVKTDVDPQKRPTLRQLDATDHPLLVAADAALSAAQLTPADIGERRQLDHIVPETGERVFVTFEPVGHEDWLIATVRLLDEISGSLYRISCAYSTVVGIRSRRRKISLPTSPA